MHAGPSEQHRHSGFDALISAAEAQTAAIQSRDRPHEQLVPAQVTTRQRPPPPYLSNLFVESPFEGQLVLEAALSGLMPILNAGPTMTASPVIESGTVVVFAENNQYSQMVRWRDGRRWSPSRPQGPYLLYREVEGATKNTFVGSPTEQSNRFTNMALRANCRFIPNGLAKRTIGLTGSDGLKYRVISYFFPLDVEHLFTPGMSGRLKPPSHYPEFQPFIEKANQQKLSPEAGLPTSSESKEKPIKPKPQKSSESIETANRTKPSPPTPYARPQPQQPQQTPMKPMQQPEQFHVRQCPQSEVPTNATVEPSVPSPVPSEQTCPCGGLGGSRKAVDYFKGKDVSWVNRPVVLAPLRGQLDRR